jgi:hypothetical protein
MAWRHKPEPPVDRAMRELDQQLKQVRREIQQLSDQPPASPSPVAAGRPPAPAPAHSPHASFISKMLTPTPSQATVTYRTRRDLFDVADKTVAQLELDALATAPNESQADLFAAGAVARTAPAAERQSTKSSKLMDYLSAGSIRTYRPLRREQREERNRFLGLIGAATVAVWVIYVLVR